MLAKDLMSTPAITVRPETPCKEAADLLTRHGISSLPVVDEAGALVGIVSEADLLPLGTTVDPRAQARPLPQAPQPSRVEEVMTRDPSTVDETLDVSLVAQLMLEGRLRHVPVLRGNTVTGVLSRRDLVRLLARRDEDIERAVQQALSQEGLRLANLRVQVREGIVELSGADPSTLRLGEILARSQPGVVQVRSREE